MHYQYWPLAVTVPAGTPASAPVSQAFPTTDGDLEQIEIQVPAGHRGQTGIRVLWHGQQIYPWANLSWLTDDNRLRTARWKDAIDGRGITVQAYNTDRVPHTFYLLAEIWPNVEPSPAEITDELTRHPTEARHRDRIGRLGRHRELVPPGG